jgi:hypothetical protein
VKQGRSRLYQLLSGKALWPPPVVPFGLDPFGWHGERSSYSEVCKYALENCILMPKVYPIPNPLYICEHQASIVTDIETTRNGLIRTTTLTRGSRTLSTREIRTEGDNSWKAMKRWIENDADLDMFLEMRFDQGVVPDTRAVTAKEEEVSQHGLPYVELSDPFSVVCEMFPTELFFTKILLDRERIETLIDNATTRVLQSIEILCRDTKAPFILRLIGAELAVPPFLSRHDFLQFEGAFYRKSASICRRHGIPVAFHCHGPVREIMEDIWQMGYVMVEPFEPPPRGNVPIAEALAVANRRGVVLGGVDEVQLHTGNTTDVSRAVSQCLQAAKISDSPYILSQSATPFYDPLDKTTKKNILIMMELGSNP